LRRIKRSVYKKRLRKLQKEAYTLKEEMGNLKERIDNEETKRGVVRSYISRKKRLKKNMDKQNRLVLGTLITKG